MTGLSGKSPFDRFLFASLSEHDGMALTVLSALARQDLDPHEEAARLGQLPRDEARTRLAAIITKINGEGQSPQQAMTTATELLALLPADSNTESDPEARIVPAVSNQAQFMMWLTYGIVLGALFFNGSNDQRPAALNHESAGTTMSNPPLPPPVDVNKVWSE
jgi:hypothetical protein